MQTTENLGLKKPDGNEFYDVNVANDNMDVVDALFEKDENGNVVAKNAKTLDGHEAEYFAPLSRVIPQKVQSGTDLNTLVKTGAYFLDGKVSDYPNVPNTDAHNGIVIVNTFKEDTANAERLVQMYFSPNLNKFYFRTSLGSVTAWEQWREVFTTAGGTIDGNVTINSNSAENRLLYLQNSLRCVYQKVFNDGKYELYDKTNGKSIIYSTADGNHTFNGVASGNLPLTGGTITSPSDVALTIGSTHTNKRVMVKYLNGSTNYGYLGFTEANKPTYASNTGVLNELLHTGNMASHVLPLSGGTLQSGDRRIMSVDNTSGAESSIGYRSAGVLLGEIGVKSSGAFFLDSSGKSNNIIHTGNINQAPTSSSLRNIQGGTTDLTAGSSNLTTGTIYVVYE